MTVIRNIRTKYISFLCNAANTRQIYGQWATDVAATSVMTEFRVLPPELVLHCPLSGEYNA